MDYIYTLAQFVCKTPRHIINYVRTSLFKFIKCRTFIGLLFGLIAFTNFDATFMFIILGGPL